MQKPRNPEHHLTDTAGDQESENPFPCVPSPLLQRRVIDQEILRASGLMLGVCKVRSFDVRLKPLNRQERELEKVANWVAK